MNNSKDLFQDFLNEISSDENKAEAISMAYLVFEKLLRLSRTDIFANRSVNTSQAQQEELSSIARRIKGHEPVQYILGEAEFLRRNFNVDPSVLIPRPETEELVMLIAKDLAEKKKKEKRIVDIGTGSGCIAISLALETQHAEVFATDVSEAALSVARKNANALQANVNFIRHNILKDAFAMRDIDVVVSNPPYIALAEKSSMMKNVLDFEPHVALFVSDNDPLLFYKVIAEKANAALTKHGALYTEINERFGKEVADVYSDRGYYDIQIFKDLSGKERIVKGVKI